MNILVSGHRGDTGSVLMDTLSSNGHTCVAYGSDDVPSHMDRLVHTAAKHPGATADDIISSNINFLQSTINDSIKNKVSDVVFLSSVSVYGNSASGLIAEQNSCCPDDLYASSKLMGEHYLKLLGINGVALRLPAVLEVHKCNNFMSRLLESLEANSIVEISNANSLFNAYIDPSDIANFVANIPTLKAFQAINFAVKAELTLKETVYILRELCGSKSQIREVGSNTIMRTYSTNLLTQLYDFQLSSPIDSLERWLNRRRIIH